MALNQRNPGMPWVAPDSIAELERALAVVAHLMASAKRHGRVMVAAGIPVGRAAVVILRLLADSGEPMRPGEIAVHLGVKAPHISHQLQRLEQDGYVERAPDDDDRRAQRIRLRDAGRELAAKIHMAERQWVLDALSGWSEEERVQLAALIGRMADDLTAYAGWCHGRRDADGGPREEGPARLTYSGPPKPSR